MQMWREPFEVAAVVVAAAALLWVGALYGRHKANDRIRLALTRAATDIRRFGEHRTDTLTGRQAALEAEYILDWRSRDRNFLEPATGMPRTRPAHQPRSKAGRRRLTRNQIWGYVTLRDTVHRDPGEDTGQVGIREQLRRRYSGERTNT